MTPAYVYGVKLAAPRWKQEMGQRMTAKPDPDALRQVRDDLWRSGTDLNADQLARHERLRELQVDPTLKATGGTREGKGIMAMMGPHLSGDQVVVPKDSGSVLRSANAPVVSKNEPWWFKHMPESGGKAQMREMFVQRGPVPGSDGTSGVVEHAITHHELGERAARRAALDPNGVGARNLASHLSEVPDLAERVPLFRHPEAQAVFDRMRAANPDDAFVQKQMRHVGGTGAAPVPLGGRQHRALAEAVANYEPQTATMARQRAASTHPALHALNALDPQQQATFKMLGMAPEHIPTVMTPKWQGRFNAVEGAVGRAGEALRKVPIGSVQSLLDKYSPTVKNFFSAGHVPHGDSSAFLRHLSGVVR